MPDQLRPGIYIVIPDGKVLPCPGYLLDTAQVLAAEMMVFVNFVQTLYPELEQGEAIYLAAAMIGPLPDLFQKSPELIERFRQDIPTLMARLRTPRTTNDPN